MVLIESNDYDVRYSHLDDTPYLRSWLKTKGMMHWFPPQTDRELDGFVNIWMGFVRFHAALTAIYQNKPVGMVVLFLMPYRKIAHHCMLQLIVDPQQTRNKIGSSLVKNAKHLAKTQFRIEELHAEIFDENPVISLLEQVGFHELGRQERYVKEEGNYYPRILMECPLL